MRSLFIKKDLNLLISDAQESHHQEKSAFALKRTLGAFQLTMLGIGAIVGAGIFSLTGTAAAYYAGPGIVYSFIIGGILCAFAGLCYAEMAAMVPVSGSAYAYSYATLGEFVAWIIGWDLVLEYAFGAVTVCVSWSGYLLSLVTKTLGIEFSDQLVRYTQGPWEWVTLKDGSQVSGIWNVPATVIALGLAGVLYRGMKESAWINNLIVLLKISIIVLFIILGWAVVDPSHWVGNSAATGLARWVPVEALTLRNGHQFMSYGWSGVLTGAGVVFFAFIGFDAVSTTAQECKNPTRDLPIGILCSLAVCTVLYVLTSLVITGVVSYHELGVADPLAVGVDRIVALRGWAPHAQRIFTFIVKLGALSGLTSVILVMMMGQTRVFYAMARDGLLPWFHQLHPRYSTPHIATLTTGLFVSICAGCMPMAIVGELVSIGTLLAFVLVCVGIPILRIKSPHVARPFRTPAYWFVAPAGAISCLWVMSGLPRDTWLRLIVWLLIGFVIYFSYSRKHSKLRHSRALVDATKVRASKASL